MITATLLQAAIARTRSLPLAARYTATLAMVAAFGGLRLLAEPVWPAGYPFLVSFVPIVLASALFDGRSGLLATAASAAFAAYFYLPPVDDMRVSAPHHIAALLTFLLVGGFTATVVETLRETLDRLHASERMKGLLLREFRHRTRNDLNSLVAMLRLRARAASSPEASAALIEACGHAMALARVHSQLDRAREGEDGTAIVDTAEFVAGMVRDIDRTTVGDGPRPVALVAEAESHPLDTERGVVLGLVIDATVTKALRHAFPGEAGGTITVRFRRDDTRFELSVADDGVGLPPEAEIRPGVPASKRLGTRLARALAAQLRGDFSRTRRPEGGTLVALTFPCRPVPTPIAART